MNNFAYIPIDLLQKKRLRAELLVYCYLASCQNKKEYCFPTQTSIAARCEISPRHARRALEELQNEGWISTLKYETGGTRNSYRVKSIFNHECTLYARVSLLSLSKIPTLSAQRVYITLCSFQGSDEYSYPSRQQIAEASKMHIRTVARSLATLSQLGLLRRIPSRGGGWSRTRYICIDATKKTPEAQLKTGTDDYVMRSEDETQCNKDRVATPHEDVPATPYEDPAATPNNNTRNNITNNINHQDSTKSTSLVSTEIGYMYDAQASSHAQHTQDSDKRRRKDTEKERLPLLHEDANAWQPHGTMKDPLSSRIENHFLTLAKNEYVHVGKERKSIQRIVTYLKRISEDPISSAHMLLKKFYELRYLSEDEFWRAQPYTPSRFLSHIPALWAKIKGTQRTQEAEERISKCYGTEKKKHDALLQDISRLTGRRWTS